MKCCGCNKAIDLTKRNPVENEAQWYGKYQDDVCLRVICNDCIKDPEKKKEYICK